MAFDPRALPEGFDLLLVQRQLGMLTTLHADGRPHMAAVGFTWDPAAGLVRVITRGHSRKARNVAEAAGDAVLGRAVVGTVAGPRWISLAGPAVVTADPERVAEAVRRYAQRYQEPRPSAERVALEISVDTVLGSPGAA